MSTGIIMIIAGLLASPKLLVGKGKAAQELLSKIAPYQGWVGFVLFIWGIWGIVQSFLNLGWLSSAPIWWATFLAIAVLEFALGLLLGFNLINQYVLSKNPKLATKGKELHAKLASKQAILGALGIAVGIWALVWELFSTSL